MTAQSFGERLVARCHRAGIELSDSSVRQLERYWDLLARWNATINLTSLPLRDAADESLDRLLVEPLRAASFVQDAPLTWYDLGSGGGSPAVPIKVVRPQLRLTMVERRARKAAFLREAVRTLGLSHTVVEAVSFEALPRSGTSDLVTIRAVRFDEVTADVCRGLLKPGGRILLFAAHPPLEIPGFQLIQTLVDGGSIIFVLDRQAGA